MSEDTTEGPTPKPKKQETKTEFKIIWTNVFFMIALVFGYFLGKADTRHEIAQTEFNSNAQQCVQLFADKFGVRK